MASRDTARRFHFIREIASGGFGSVYLAKVMHHDGFSRLAAVKLLHRRWSENEEVAQRMRDEARLLGWLRHRNIVDVVDLTSIDGRAAVVMEYLEAIDLKQVVRSMRQRGDHIPARTALEMIAYVASALDAAYNRPPYAGEKPLRVIHRDIKPSNIMVDDTGMVKVLDFGVARADFDSRESETRDLQFGSVDYMPPERMFFEPETPAADVYSLGASLYELLALEKLGKAKMSAAKHAAFVADRLSYLRGLLSVPGRQAGTLEDLLHTSLAFDPGERPAAAEVVIHARTLARSLGDEGLVEWSETHVPGLLEEVRNRPAKENPLTDSILTEDSLGFSRAAETVPAPTGEVAPAGQEEPKGPVPETDPRWAELRRAARQELERPTPLTPLLSDAPQPDEVPAKDDGAEARAAPPPQAAVAEEEPPPSKTALGDAPAPRAPVLTDTAVDGAANTELETQRMGVDQVDQLRPPAAEPRAPQQRVRPQLDLGPRDPWAEGPARFEALPMPRVIGDEVEDEWEDVPTRIERDPVQSAADLAAEWSDLPTRILPEPTSPIAADGGDATAAFTDRLPDDDDDGDATRLMPREEQDVAVGPTGTEFPDPEPTPFSSQRPPFDSTTGASPETVTAPPPMDGGAPTQALPPVTPPAAPVRDDFGTPPALQPITAPGPSPRASQQTLVPTDDPLGAETIARPMPTPAPTPEPVVAAAPPPAAETVPVPDVSADAPPPAAKPKKKTPVLLLLLLLVMVPAVLAVGGGAVWWFVLRDVPDEVPEVPVEQPDDGEPDEQTPDPEPEPEAPDPEPGEPEPEPEPEAPEPEEPEPEPEPPVEASGIRFVSAVAGKLSVRCAGGRASGQDEVSLDIESSDKCQVQVMLADMSRKTATVTSVTAGTWTCFEGGDATCSKD